MSTHPDNPWWSQDRDAPIQISTRELWAEAEARGYVTAEHVLLRLEAMFRHAMGDETDGGVAYDEDGFIRAMVAAGWTGEGWRIQLHPNDHDPPHVHFWLKGDQRAQVRLSLATGEPLDGEALPTGSKKRLAKASQFVVANQPLLMSKWTEAHPIVGSSQPLGPDSDPT